VCASQWLVESDLGKAPENSMFVIQGVNAVKYRLTFALVLLFCRDASAGTQLPVRVSPNFNILIRQGDERVKNAHVDIYRVFDKGESFIWRDQVWSGSSDASGVASPPELPLGKYRIFADTGTSESEVYVDVATEYKWDRATIYLPPSNEAIADAVVSTPMTAIVREFRGIVQYDTVAAFIPKVKIRIFRKDELGKSYIGQIQSDEEGKFTMPLDKGTYVAVFQRNGFKMRSVGFEVGEKGDSELRLRLSSEAHQVPYFQGTITPVPKN
jgi:hypothetical protein